MLNYESIRSTASITKKRFQIENRINNSERVSNSYVALCVMKKTESEFNEKKNWKNYSPLFFFPLNLFLVDSSPLLISI